MTPILGIMASAISGNLWAPGKDYDSIATVTVGPGGAIEAAFTSIPSTYKHLQVRMLVRSTTTNGDVRLFVNTSLFSARRHTLSGDGGSISAGSDTANSIARQTQSSDAASVFAVSIIDILDYANTNKYKTIRQLGGFDLDGSGAINLASQLIQDTAAISALSVSPYNGTGSFAQYSHIALYGVK